MCIFSISFRRKACEVLAEIILLRNRISNKGDGNFIVIYDATETWNRLIARTFCTVSYDTKEN